MRAITYIENLFSFEGAISVQTTEQGVQPWRIEHRYQDFFPVLKDEKAQESSGIRLCFTTDSVNLQLKLGEVVPGMKLDLFVDETFRETVEMIGTETTVTFKPLPGGIKKIQVWLDQRYRFILREIAIDNQALIRKTLFTQKRWVHYGSSISHVKEANQPSVIWAGIVARKLNLHLTNLGYSGQCKIDPMVARLIRDLPADYITLKLGINLYSGDLTVRTFAPNIIGMIQLIREKHPNTPLAVVSPIYSKPREAIAGGSGFTLPEMREVIADIVLKTQQYGDRNIYHVDGLKIFNAQAAEEFMPDELHPSSDGQPLLAENFINEVFTKFPMD